MQWGVSVKSEVSLTQSSQVIRRKVPRPSRRGRATVQVTVKVRKSRDQRGRAEVKPQLSQVIRRKVPRPVRQGRATVKSKLEWKSRDQRGRAEEVSQWWLANRATGEPRKKKRAVGKNRTLRWCGIFPRRKLAYLFQERLIIFPVSCKTFCLEILEIQSPTSPPLFFEKNAGFYWENIMSLSSLPSTKILILPTILLTILLNMLIINTTKLY